VHLTKELTMDNGQMMQAIRETNLTYLMLAQNLVRQDRAEALFRLGLPEESADLLAALSPAQMLKVASNNMLLCRFRIDDNLVWSLLTNHGLRKSDCEGAARLHAGILMAGRHAEAT
jgi:flagellar transcriptional activator FlhD